MAKQFIIVLSILLVACAAHAASYSDWWQKGNQAYQQKNYDSAAHYFEQIAATHPQNAIVYYNLGNAYYRLNKIGAAVLNYKRALQIAPNYKDAKDNLALTEDRIPSRIQSGGDIFFITWWQGWTSAAHATTLAVISLLLFIIVLVLLLMRRLFSSNFPPQLTGFAIVCFALFMALSVTAANRKVHTGSAVVMQNDAPLMNDNRSKTLVLIPEGTTVDVQQTTGSWQQVQLPDGRTGWVQAALLSNI